ncbi:hypothetical protein [Labedella endophytica]|uniref:DNA modification methylase n=1 Tax=Labedella endophytica TaxID=1523160 RepID=A0A3S0X955_9MICO|nr:hypothetical protein [Labedella endophytica]RUQ99015.1 hypothetical protein ELQ94_11885 [Labedella endophytica]
MRTRARVIASIVMAATVALGTTSCNLLAPQATLKKYDPSDGVSATVGDVAVRNAIVFADGEDTGFLLATVINTGSAPHSVSIQVGSGDDRQDFTLTVAGGSTTTYSAGDAQRLELDPLQEPAGAVIPVFVQYGQEEGVEIDVPVLEQDTFAEYATLTPTPAPSE